MKIYHFFCAVLFNCIFSCNQTDNSNRENSDDSMSVKASSKMEPITKSDSATVIYYLEPGKPRFFKITKIKDFSRLAQSMNDILVPPSFSSQSCQTDGKIYFYGTKDEVYVTYFSLNDSCKTFSFVHTGVKYVLPMSESAFNELKSLKMESVEPMPVSTESM